MIKLIRFVGLIIQSILIEFLHVFGLVAFLLAAALGYFRAPSWLVPIVALSAASSPTNSLTRRKSSPFSNGRRPPISAADSW
ncbi:hypothetical protein [Methylocystis rosea]|uniref:hypothetical protein n=1 Tax=Methylocystis rosea TaxID=173366 RepID=UPI001FEE073F|nr:hypothetical protein [Methylocystis rosea]